MFVRWQEIIVLFGRTDLATYSEFFFFYFLNLQPNLLCTVWPHIPELHCSAVALAVNLATKFWGHKKQNILFLPRRWLTSRHRDSFYSLPPQPEVAWCERMLKRHTVERFHIDGHKRTYVGPKRTKNIGLYFCRQCICVLAQMPADPDFHITARLMARTLYANLSDGSAPSWVGRSSRSSFLEMCLMTIWWQKVDLNLTPAQSTSKCLAQGRQLVWCNTFYTEIYEWQGSNTLNNCFQYSYISLIIPLGGTTVVVSQCPLHSVDMLQPCQDSSSWLVPL